MPRYTREEAEKAVRTSLSYTEALRKLKMRAAGGNHQVFRRWVDEVWRIPTDHFDPDAARLRGFKKEAVPLAEIMVENSTYSRSSLKRRLLSEGLKEARCEECGQGEQWRGARMALILDHINGVPDDHRLENLRILCPNCAATLETHCGCKNLKPKVLRSCSRCGEDFLPKRLTQRFCSRTCAGRANAEPRRVQRPPFAQLLREIGETNYCAVGRKYGVSDNAIRKWVRAYVRERDEEIRAAGFRFLGPA